MTQLPEEWTDDETLGFFNRHLVPLYFDMRRGDEERYETVWTAFVLSVRGRWLLMTAGHCITEMEEHRAAGWHIERARLMDGLNAGAGYLQGVPFDYDSFRPAKLGPDVTHDYGLLVPTDTAVLAMRANRVVPFTDALWDHEDREFELYKLLGVPADLLAKKEPDATSIATLFQKIYTDSSAARRGSRRRRRRSSTGRCAGIPSSSSAG